MLIKVMSCEKKKGNYSITVEPNGIFYVDGKGGQLGDRGSIGNASVLEVHENEIIIDRFLEIGEHSYTIDKKRQDDIAQQHSAQHTFSAIAFNNYNLNTVGFRMGEEYTTVDLDSNNLTEEIVAQLEKKVNEVIDKQIPVKIFTLKNEEAMKINDLRKAINEKVTGDVRFVEIPEIDLGACAGFHVENTGKIKLFKIINHEKIKGNFTRFYFLAGERAMKDYRYKHMLSKELCQKFSCKDNEILDMVDKVAVAKVEAENEVKNISIEYSQFLAEVLLKDSVVINSTRVIFYFGNKSVGDMLHKIIQDEDVVIVSGSNENYSVSSKKINCKELIGAITKTCNQIKGGGNQIRGNFKGNIEKNSLIESVKAFIEGSK